MKKTNTKIANLFKYIALFKDRAPQLSPNIQSSIEKNSIEFNQTSPIDQR